MNIKSTLLSTLLLIFFNSQSFGQLVSDSTFSQDGYFITSTPAGGSKYATRIKELSDGSILTVGCGEQATNLNYGNIALQNACFIFWLEWRSYKSTIRCTTWLCLYH